MSPRVDDYVAAMGGWRAELAGTLRATILSVGGLTEDFKWAQPVYASGKGRVCFLKAGRSDLLLGFWRGQQMAELGDRLSPFGSYRMAGVKFTGPGEIEVDFVLRLVEAGVSLNAQYGDPLKEPKVK